MKVKIYRIDKSLPLPEYKTEGAVAMDLSARIDLEIKPKQTGFVPLNIAVQAPRGWFVFLAARSGLAKRGLMMVNGVGLIDEDYSGDGDELTAFLYNFTDAPVLIKKGERLLQLMVFPYGRVEWREVETLNNPNRGGFGSTGRYS